MNIYIASKQSCYRQGFISLTGFNPFNRDSSRRQCVAWYAFNAGVVDRASGFEYDGQATR